MYEGDWQESYIDGFGILYDSGKIYIGKTSFIKSLNINLY